MIAERLHTDHLCYAVPISLIVSYIRCKSIIIIISLIKLTPPHRNGFEAPIFQILGGSDKNGICEKGLATRLDSTCDISTTVIDINSSYSDKFRFTL